MKNNIVLAGLARGAVASTLAACLMPQSHTKEMATSISAGVTAFNNEVAMPEQATREGAQSAIVLPISQAPNEWSRQMEREFRTLAMAEAKGTLAAEKGKRLEELNRWRDRFLSPQPAKEILLQIRHDRLLARMKEVLNDYVEFHNPPGKSRAST